MQQSRQNNKKAIHRYTITDKLADAKAKLKKEYKERFDAVKPKLPYNWRTILFEQEEIYNNRQGYTLINNVIGGKTEDFRILGIMEQIAENYTQQKTA